MQITKINTAQSHQIAKPHKKVWKNPLRDTGYAAVALGVASAAAAGNRKIKLHKYLAYASGVFTLVHIGIVEYYKHKKPVKTTSVIRQNS